MVRSRWKSRKNKKRAMIRRRSFIKSHAKAERVPAPKPTAVGKALSQIANRMGKRGQ